jgi:hypothetical protein
MFDVDSIVELSFEAKGVQISLVAWSESKLEPKFKVGR